MRGKTAALYGLVALTGWHMTLHAEDALPAEVVQFIEQRTLCDHFRDEPWPEGDSQEERERRTFLSTQLEQLCKGSDERLRLLREHYRGDQKVVEALKGFEDTIEAR
ncbi:MAG TPA: hypothetical protein VGE50_11540 [Gammaproteobacteria bacterium]